MVCDVVMCEIKIDLVMIVWVVLYVMKYIVCELEDAYEFSGRECDGECGGDVGEMMMRWGMVVWDDVEVWREMMERGVGEGWVMSGMGEVNVRWGRDRETSSGETGEVTMRSRGDERGGRMVWKVGEDVDVDELYVWFEDLFGVKVLFVKLNSRARGI